jgi:hypothetical protein
MQLSPEGKLIVSKGSDTGAAPSPAAGLVALPLALFTTWIRDAVIEALSPTVIDPLEWIKHPGAAILEN